MLLITKIIPISIVLIQTQTDVKPRSPKKSLGILSDRNSLTDCDSDNVNSDEAKIVLEDCTDNPLSETKTENYKLDIDPFVELEKSIESQMNVEIKSNKNKSRKQSLNIDLLRCDFPEDVVNLDNQSLEPVNDVMSVHEEKNHRFFCSICNKSYIDMPHHIKQKHHKQIKTFKCNICEYEHKYYYLLEKHIKSVHEVINPFKCNNCTYDAVNKTDLKKHMKNVHEEIETFKCSICDYETAQNKDLKIHKKSVHEEIKSFKCHICAYDAVSKTQLKRHINSLHERIKPFKCNSCNYETAEKGHLKRHIESVHERIRPFKCKTCDFETAEKGNLKTHIATVHEGINPFKCNFCDYECSRKINLDSHTKSVHNLTNNHSIEAQDVLKESFGISSDRNSLTDGDREIVSSDDPKIKLEDCKDDPLFETKTENYELDIDPFIELEKTIEPSMNVEIKSNKNKSGKQSSNLDPLRCDFPEDAVNLVNQSNENGKKLDKKGMVICKICGFTTTLEGLKSHMNLKHENKCSFCELKFDFEIQLEDHTEAKHLGTLELKYFCSECGDGFMFKSNLVKHVIENKHKKVNENKSDSPTNDIQTQVGEKSRTSLMEQTIVEEMMKVGNKSLSIIPNQENIDKKYGKRKQSINHDSLRKDFPETTPKKRVRGITSSFSKSAKEIYETSLGISSAVVINLHLKEKEKTYCVQSKTSFRPSCRNCNQSFVNLDHLDVHSCLAIKQGTQEIMDNALIMESVSDIDPFLEHSTIKQSQTSNIVVVNKEKLTKYRDINNQGIIFQSIKVEHPTIQQSQISDTADPLIIPEFKEEIFEENEKATPIQDLNEVYINQEESGASVYQNEQENRLIDQEIKEEFDLGE